jgi:F-type H+-transporting ATPase subunit epsilon
MSDLKVEIISVAGELLKGSFNMVVVPSVSGDLGVMQGHEVVIAALREGEVTVYDDKQNVVKTFPVKSGFAEVQESGKLLVLID